MFSQVSNFLNFKIANRKFNKIDLKSIKLQHKTAQNLNLLD